MLLPHSNVQLGLDQCTPKQLERIKRAIAKNIARGVKSMWRQLSHETKGPTK